MVTFIKNHESCHLDTFADLLAGGRIGSKFVFLKALELLKSHNLLFVLAIAFNNAIEPQFDRRVNGHKHEIARLLERPNLKRIANACQSVI